MRKKSGGVGGETIRKREERKKDGLAGSCEGVEGGPRQPRRRSKNKRIVNRKGTLETDSFRLQNKLGRDEKFGSKEGGKVVSWDEGFKRLGQSKKNAEPGGRDRAAPVPLNLDDRGIEGRILAKKKKLQGEK